MTIEEMYKEIRGMHKGVKVILPHQLIRGGVNDIHIPPKQTNRGELTFKCIKNRNTNSDSCPEVFRYEP